MRAAQASFGIDFGTTNSAVALATEAGVEMLPFDDGAVSARSLLYLEKDGGRLRSASGAEAIRRYLMAHEEGDRPGRLMQSLKSYLSARTLTTTEVFGRAYTLEELIARMLGDLRAQAERHFGVPVRRATVGRPVRFVGAESEADDTFAEARLRAAFLQAGFEDVRFEYEPLGAAATWQARSAGAEVVLIGDFGGGTSDFSLLRLAADGSRALLGHAGLPFAGDAFDAKLVRHLVAPALGSESHMRGGKSIPAVPAWIYANLERWHYLSFLRTRPVLELLTTAIKRAEEPERVAALLALVEEDLGYQLHQAVQRVKTALSTAESAGFEFAGAEAGSLELRGQVTRAEFEGWVAPELERMAASVDGLLQRAGMTHAGVDRVFLTGGTSFVPAVRRIFAERFGGRIASGGEFTSVAGGLALLGSGR